MSGAKEEQTGNERFGCIVMESATLKFALKPQKGMSADGDSDLSELTRWAG